jgi:hypothetical protein
MWNAYNLSTKVLNLIINSYLPAEYKTDYSLNVAIYYNKNIFFIDHQTELLQNVKTFTNYFLKSKYFQKL